MSNQHASPNSKATDIAIVGGGMVGATMAALLAYLRSDWRITLIESFEFPKGDAPAYQTSYDDRSTALAHGTVELFEQMGLWPLLSQYATSIRQVHVSDRGHFGGTVIDAEKLTVDAVGQVVANAHLGRTLLRHIQQSDSIRILAPASVTGLQPLQQGVNLQIKENGGQYDLTTQLAIIADGAESILRSRLGIDVKVEDYQQSAIIANVTLSHSHDHVAYERFTDQGPMALLPLGGKQGNQSALVWTQPAYKLDAILKLSDADFLAELQQRFGFRLGHFAAVGKRDSYPLYLKVASEQVRSSLVIMGNAAHFLHPVAGQGFNLAVRDCAALASILNVAQQQHQALGSLSVLRNYEQQQQSDQLATIQFSDKITRLFSTSSLPAALLRGLGFFGLEIVPPAKQILTTQTIGQGGKRVIPITESK
jgi:2-polyprenyl-6-methoxyphenol 4-hydroxylase